MMDSEYMTGIKAAWQISGGKCQCARFGHDHPYIRCTKSLLWEKQDKGYPGGWKVNRCTGKGKGPLAFEILCWGCYLKTNR